MSSQFDENIQENNNYDCDLENEEIKEDDEHEVEMETELEEYSYFGNPKYGTWHSVYDTVHKKNIFVFVYEKNYKGRSDVLSHGMIAHVQYANHSMTDIAEESCVILKDGNMWVTTVGEFEDMKVLNR